MKAIYVYEHGSPEVLIIREIPVPDLQSDEILVKNSCIGINYVDIQHRTGVNYPIQLPFIPGIEAVGTVSEKGSKVTKFKKGDRVGFAGYMGGNYAEYTSVPEEKLIPIPNTIDDITAAASLLQGMTAHCLSRDVYKIKKNDNVLIHAGAGGVGLFLVQMAKNSGAQVFVTVSNKEKEKVAKSFGADHIINYMEKDFEQEILRINDGQDLDVVYDSVGKNTFDKGLNLLKAKGHMVVFGLSSGPVVSFDINRLSGITGSKSKGSLFLTWATLSDYTATSQELLGRAKKLFQLLDNGSVQPHIHETFPFEDITKAHKMLETRKVSGKILIIP